VDPTRRRQWFLGLLVEYCYGRAESSVAPTNCGCSSPSRHCTWKKPIVPKPNTERANIAGLPNETKGKGFSCCPAAFASCSSWADMCLSRLPDCAPHQVMYAHACRGCIFQSSLTPVLLPYALSTQKCRTLWRGVDLIVSSLANSMGTLRLTIGSDQNDFVSYPPHLPSS
jgi:hypothetical protein